MDNQISFIKLNPGAADAIRESAAYRSASKSIRVNTAFKGCGDPSLELRMGTPMKGDLQCTVDGLHFLMQPGVFDLTGKVTVSTGNGLDPEKFILTSVKPLSEWDGFGECGIQS